MQTRQNDQSTRSSLYDHYRRLSLSFLFSIATIAIFFRKNLHCIVSLTEVESVISVTASPHSVTGEVKAGVVG